MEGAGSVRLNFWLSITLSAAALAALIAAACADGSSSASQSPTATATATPPTLARDPSATTQPTREPAANTPTATATPRPAATATATPPPTPSPTATPGALPSMDIEPAFPNLSFARMVRLTFSGADDDLLYVVLQPGRIIAFENDGDADSATIFLDIRGRVSDAGNEEGLLGLAFDPDYASNGYFFVYYSAASPRRSVISRFKLSGEEPTGADPSSELVILEVPQPFGNHNGGEVLFGPDGYLYVGLGDGGSGGAPRGNGQDPSTLLGAILRIDVSNLDAGGGYAIPPDNPFAGEDGGAREEIWAYGLRNPWRFSFDGDTGDLWAGDVGQNRFEEIDIIKPGVNYGWNVMEGFHCYRATTCDDDGLEPPVIEYGRDGGCSVTGGYVYRGTRVTSLRAAYIYGDFCSGHIWAIRHDGDRVTEHRLIASSGVQIPAFGEGPSGEFYVLSFDGTIYRLRPQ